MTGDLFNPLPPDHEERQRIENELDVTMLVEAAAGTGKTTSLLNRMVRLLAEGRCTVGTMAAVTFTRKATAELRSRFQVALEGELHRATGVRRARLQEAMDHVEQCLIGTIHSFCGRLLRERPIEAGVDIAFEELDEAAEGRLRREAWNEHLARMHAAGDPIIAQLYELGLEPGELRETYLEFADYPDVEQWPAPACDLDPALAEGARKALREWRDFAGSVGELPRHAGNDKLIPFLRDLPRRLRNMTLSRDRELMDLLEECLRHRNVVLKEWPGKRDRAQGVKARWHHFLDAIAIPLMEQWRLKRYGTVLEVLLGAVVVFAGMRQARGALSYQDLLMKAAALLRDKPHIRRYFRERFTHLLVDEFQDTDPVQAEVMLLLTADDPTQCDWRKCKPVDGSLFVVGDPRQSIYRFRRADIVTYNEVQRIIGKHGRLVRLRANFRSTAPLIDWFNKASASLFAAPSDYSPPDSRMLAARPGPEAGECSGVHALEIPFTNGDDAEAFEADAIARIIRDALDRRLSLPRTPEEARQKPPHVTPGDFMILTAYRGALLTYARRLQACGIAAEVTGGTAVNDDDEVALLRAVLAAVVEPDNPVALVGALRSELFGISDTALYRFERGGGAFNYYLTATEPNEGGVDAHIADAMARLRTYAGWFSTMQPVAAAERVATDLGLFARAASGPAGTDRAGVLCKAIELLRSASRELWSPADLVEYLGQLVEPGAVERHDGLPLRPHEGQAVRLMNLHQAKGLEAPIVFLAESSGAFQRKFALHVDRRGGTVVGFLRVRGEKRGDYGPGPVLAAPENWAQCEAEELLYREAELDRLLYVAATRAAVQLVIGRPQSKRRWEKLLAHVPAGAVMPVPPQASAPDVQTETLPDDAVQAFDAALRERRKSAAGRTWDVRGLKEMVVGSGRASRPGEHGTEWGSVIHVLLEAAMSRGGADLGALAASALEEEELDPARGDEAIAQVRAVMASDLWRRAQAASERLTEVPIQYLQPGGSGEGGVPTIVRGVIDLVFREAGGWVIVDYKTDDRDESGLADLAGHYAPQVRAYASAWVRLTSEPVAEAFLHFVGTRRSIRVELAEEAPAGA